MLNIMIIIKPLLSLLAILSIFITAYLSFRGRIIKEIKFLNFSAHQRLVQYCNLLTKNLDLIIKVKVRTECSEPNFTPNPL